MRGISIEYSVLSLFIMPGFSCGADGDIIGTLEKKEEVIECFIVLVRVVKSD